MQKYKSTFILIVKLLIVSGAYFFISHKITYNEVVSSTKFLTLLRTNILSNSTIIIIVFLFTISNWLLEITKWKTLVSTIYNISFYEASKQSLSSLTASLLTPNRIGEYGAKAIYYSKKERYKIMFLNLIGNINQMAATILFGVFGLIFLYTDLPSNIKIYLFYITIIVCFFVFISFFTLKNIIKKYTIKFIYLFHRIPYKIHLKTFCLSSLKYVIFSHQFYFLLISFGINLDYFIAMQIIFAMYLIASIIPSFVFFDWLIKGSVAVTLFSVFGVNEILILSITSIMWLLNFALPSIIGSYFVLTFAKPKEILIRENSHSA